MGQVDKMAGAIEVNGTAGVNRLIFIQLWEFMMKYRKFSQWNNRMIGSDLVRYRHAASIETVAGLYRSPPVLAH